MSQELVNLINNLDDSKSVNFFNFIGENILKGIQEDDISGKIADTYKADKSLLSIKLLDEEVMMHKISPKDSSEIARNYLLYMAKDKNLSLILKKALEEYQEKEVLIVETVLAVGFAASMIIFASTTEIKGKAFGMEFHKNEATPELVKAIMEPFAKLLEKIT